MSKIFQKIFKGKKKPFSAWQVELTTKCPLRCRMCIREGFEEWHSADMGIENFKKLIPIQTFIEIKKTEKLKKPDLHLVYLMLKDNISEVPLLIQLAKDTGIETVILTNIIHVTNEWQEKQRIFSCNKSSLHPPSIPPLVRGDAERLKDGKGDYEEILKEAEAKAKDLNIRLRYPSLSPIEVSICEENPLTISTFQ